MSDDTALSAIITQANALTKAREELDRLRVRLAAYEREGPTLQAAANRVCQHAPEGCEIVLRMENGAATVDLVDRSGKSFPLPDSADKSLAEQLNDALCVANGWTTVDITRTCAHTAEIGARHE